VLKQDVQERLWEVSAQRTGLPVEDMLEPPVAA
jgi:hypothetical protein